jgi:hypothetical protein
MAIPEDQLETWSHQGSITQSSDTYNSIRNVLEAAGTPYAGKNYEIFLQGSYGNDTNIRTESDVDIVIQLNAEFYYDLDKLKDDDKQKFRSAFSDGVYPYADFKRDVSNVLTARYGTEARQGTKAITVIQNGNRRKSDVIVATSFRDYSKFNGSADEQHRLGMCFFNAAGERIVNYPKIHSANLTKKHQAADTNFKPMVRVIKNIRSRLLAEGRFGPNVAPSYYLEGLLYNVPNDRFVGSYQDMFLGAMDWIQTVADKQKLVCANENYYLLRENSHMCWNPQHAEIFLEAAQNLWDQW